mmetsp:Transcript_11220/g.32280  ORF Transcript_11220/g.32280 Transcript_11220/m.32280 type:complete len:291 (-) Transcript_11220:2460-3332(-)
MFWMYNAKDPGKAASELLTVTSNLDCGPIGVTLPCTNTRIAPLIIPAQIPSLVAAMASMGCNPTLPASVMNWSRVNTLEDCSDAGDVADRVPQCWPNSGVVIVNGAMGEPPYSNFCDAPPPSDASGASLTLPSNPSAANGSTMVEAGGAAGAGAACAAAAAPPSSSLTVSTTGGGASACGGGGAAKMSMPGSTAGAGAGVLSNPPRSSKSTSTAGGGAGAATGGAATGAGLGGGGGATGADACDGGGGACPGTMPPNRAAAILSFSSCSLVFSTGAGGGAAAWPYPPYCD